MCTVYLRMLPFPVRVFFTLPFGPTVDVHTCTAVYTTPMENGERSKRIMQSARKTDSPADIAGQRHKSRTSIVHRTHLPQHTLELNRGDGRFFLDLARTTAVKTYWFDHHPPDFDACAR